MRSARDFWNACHRARNRGTVFISRYWSGERTSSPVVNESGTETDVLAMDHQLMLCGAILTVCGLLKKKLLASLKKKKKRFWVRSLLKNRNRHGASETLCKELQLDLECDVEIMIIFSDYLMTYLKIY